MPRVSVIMPCLNEARCIRASLGSVLSGTFPAGDMEVLVIDGGSSDGTQAILEEMAARDGRVRLLQNPRRLTPIALNLGVRAARGDIVLRVDAHSVYPPEYVETLVRTLEQTGAEMVGGCLEHAPAPGEGGILAQAIAAAVGSPFGTGSPFRYRKRSGPVDAVAFGCWRRELFDKVGLFDERLLRNQDNEHSSRIIREGGIVYMTDEVTVQYHPRADLPSLWRQARLNGMWNAFTERLYPYTFRWRHFLPGLFALGAVAVALTLALTAAGIIRDGRLAAAALICFSPYLAINLAVSSRLARELAGGAPLRALTLAPLLGFIFFSYHFTYGLGVIAGWLLVATGGWRRHLGPETQEDLRP